MERARDQAPPCVSRLFRPIPAVVGQNARKGPITTKAMTCLQTTPPRVCHHPQELSGVSGMALNVVGDNWQASVEEKAQARGDDGEKQIS